MRLSSALNVLHVLHLLILSSCCCSVSGFVATPSQRSARWRDPTVTTPSGYIFDTPTEGQRVSALAMIATNPTGGMPKRRLRLASTWKKLWQQQQQQKRDTPAVSTAAPVTAPVANTANTATSKRVPRAAIFASIFSCLFLRLFSVAFVRTNALPRMHSNLRFFLTIPILAGVCNAVTNKLAVWMMFYPIKFQGLTIPLWSPTSKINQRKLKLGWQGIVPCQVRRMGTDISELLLKDLLDVSSILQHNLDATKLAKLLLNDGDTDKQRLLELCRSITIDYLHDNPSFSFFLPGKTTKEAVVQQFLTTDRMERILTRVIQKVQDDFHECIDLQHQVVESMAQNPKLIVDLFETCGKDELKFMVVSGGYGGAMLGLGQMLLYAMLPQAWTLVVGGALVGYATDTAALKIMFAPVEPTHFRVPFTKHTKKIQGLFLQRQDQVSSDFAVFATRQLLQPEAIWKALLTGPCRSGFTEKVVEALKAELPPPLDRNKSLHRDLVTLSSTVLDRMADDIPYYTESTHSYLEENLELETSIRDAMISLPSAKFERVLHPVFEQDEATLIAVGSVLGGLVGLAQAVG